MSISCASFAAKFPHVFGERKRKNSSFTPIHLRGSFLFLNFHTRSCNIPFPNIVSVDSNRTRSCLTMEGQYQTTVACPEADKYQKELDVSVRAIQMACSLCQRVQESLISKTYSQIQSKDDDSPVTIAGSSLTVLLFLRFLELGSC